MRKADMEYVPIEGMSNALKEVQPGELRVGFVPQFEPFFKGLVLTLMSRNPEWVFIEAWKGWGLENAVTRTNIYHDNELLGWVAKKGWGGDIYEFYNHRIEKALLRRTTQWTKNKAKAIKLIEASFYGKKDSELIVDAAQQAKQVAGACVNKLNYDFTTKLHTLRPSMEKHMLDNWEQIGPKIATPEMVETLPEAQRKKKEGERIGTALSNTRGAVVFTKGEKYLVQSMGTEGYRQYDTYSLPGVIKGAVGLLKLLPKDGDYIADVGVKIAGNNFYVMKDVEEKEQDDD